MDQIFVERELKALYKHENRQAKLGTEEEYVARHIANIIEEGGGTYKDSVANEYIERLKASI